MTAANGSESWIEYRRLVLKELQDLNARMKSAEKCYGDIKRELVLIRWKVATISAGSGTIFGLLAAWLFSKAVGG